MNKRILWVTAKDTIAALATAPGIGSVSIIRLSGPKARSYAQKLCKINLDKVQSHTFRYIKIFNIDNIFIDQALILWFEAPKSFTGEDVIEIQCHGSPFSSKQILQACIEAGARMAEPGEFSFRAFRNQKIDLCQAESLNSLISAKSEFSHKVAKEQLSGALSTMIQRLQKEITHIVAVLEAMIDYPEEGIDYPSSQELMAKIESIVISIQRLIASFKQGQKLSDAIKVGIVGRTNVGKSSLLNLLLMKNRAIVTNQAGTTRDQIEEEIEIGAYRFRIIDTAGIRKTDNEVESIGIERSKAVIQSADLLLFIIDSTQTLSHNEIEIIKKLDKDKTLIIYNKCDLCKVKSRVQHFTSQDMSTKDNIGLTPLKQWLLKKATPPNESVYIVKQRHVEALKKAKQKLILAKTNITNAPAEICAIDLREALEALSHIIGKNISEEILADIFLNFCVGK